MKIIELNIDELIPYENNAKEHPREQIEQIKLSIQDFGNNDPVAIDENNVIIEGHGRYEALKELGYEKVECIRLSHLTEEQKKAYRLIHNKLTMNSDWDFSKLEEELNELSGLEFDMSLFNFDMSFSEEVKSESESDEDYQEQQEEVPESFDEYDEDLETKHQCPKCGYEWS